MHHQKLLRICSLTLHNFNNIVCRHYENSLRGKIEYERACD